MNQVNRLYHNMHRMHIITMKQQSQAFDTSKTMAHMYARAWHHAEHKFACTVLRNYTVEDICILAMHSTYDDGTRKKTDANPNIRIIISIYLSTSSYSAFDTLGMVSLL